MITIFCDIRHFADKILAFFIKNPVMIKVMNNLTLFFFAENAIVRHFWRSVLELMPKEKVA
jgi:hypothetical protein